MSTPTKSTPLSYDSLRHVICHFEPNLRRQYIDRMPGIRSVEKSTSVNIRDLHFHPAGLKLNDTTYQLGIICQSREGENPSMITRRNNNGGDRQELNQFGLEDRELAMALTPGDILLHVPELEDVMNDIEQVQGRRDRMEQHLRQTMNRRNALVDGPVIEERKRDLDQGINNIRVALEKSQLRLNGLICQRDNVPSSLDMHIQLTKTSSVGTVSIERFNYNQDLAAALKYLTTKLLGQKNDALNIKTLTFYADSSILRIPWILRLPRHLKLSTQNLCIYGPFSETINRLKPILENFTGPFNELEVRCFAIDDCTHPVVQNAKLLIINHFVEGLATLQSITNKNVIYNGTNLEDHGALIQHWKATNGRDVGTCFMFQMQDEENALETLRRVKEQFQEAVEGEKLLTIPFPNSTQLNISIDTVPDDMASRHPWLLKIEIVSIGDV